MTSPKLLPETKVNLTTPSCKRIVAKVEKSKAHKSLVPKRAPAFAAVVTVPGPIKAAEITDQSNTLPSPPFQVILFDIK